MLGLTHSYAALLAKEGITANTVCLALVETEMLRANPRATSSVIPVGRFGNVDEVASVVLLLAENAYMTDRPSIRTEDGTRVESGAAFLG